jgi:ABC-type uncharacterized transport system involved in gliding motility auxiliary subunit
MATVGIDQSQRTRTLVNASITVVAAAGIIILLQFFIGPRLFGRLDLTETKFHTLSEASKNAAAALDDVTVRVYISEPLPDSITLSTGQTVSLRGVAQSFRDKLEEYRAFSDGKMKVIYVTEDVRDEAEKAKLQLFTAEEAKVQKGRLELAEYALGATFHYRNVKEVLPLALQPETLEFDVTRILLRLKDKYEKSQAMKQMLDKGKSIHEAVKSCNLAVQDANKKADAAPGEEDGLKGLIAAAEKAGQNIDKLRAAKDTFDKECQKVAELMKADGAKLREERNEYLDIFLGGVDEFVQTYQALLDRLGATDEGESMQALEVQKLLQVVFDEVDRDHENFANSPGQKRIGFVCGNGEFCPFNEDQPVVREEMAALLGQQNPMVQQIVAQAKQIEDNVNQINYSINQNLFKRRGFDIAKVDLEEGVDSDISALIVYAPTEALSQRELFELDQFALSGRPVVVFVKSWDVSLLNIKASEELGEEPDFEYTAIGEVAGNIGDILAHYGIELEHDLVAEPKDHEIVLLTVTTQQGRLRWQSQRAFPYPLLPTFKDLNQESVLLRNVANVTLPYASTMKASDKAGSAAQVLVRSSAQARAVAKADVPKLNILPPETLASMTSMAANGGKPVVMMLEAPAESFFKGKEVPKKESAEKPEGEDAAKDEEKSATELRRKDSGNVRLLVVGSNLGLDSLNARDVLKGFDMAGLAQGGFDVMSKLQGYAAKLQNWQLRISQTGEVLQDNIRLLFNVLDWSIQNEALVEVRSKGYGNRPLDQVEDGTKRLVTYGNIFGVPALFLMFGGLRYAVSRNRRARLKV